MRGPWEGANPTLAGTHLTSRMMTGYLGGQFVTEVLRMDASIGHILHRSVVFDTESVLSSK